MHRQLCGNHAARRVIASRPHHYGRCASRHQAKPISATGHGEAEGRIPRPSHSWRKFTRAATAGRQPGWHLGPNNQAERLRGMKPVLPVRPCSMAGAPICKCHASPRRFEIAARHQQSAGEAAGRKPKAGEMPASTPSTAENQASCEAKRRGAGVI